MSSVQLTKVYVLDNGKSYSSHFLMFVEAVPSDFEPLWALYEKAWPRVCRHCGVRSEHNRCSVNLNHELPEVYMLVAVASSFDWRICRSATIVEWLDELANWLGEDVADVEAANDFVLMARQWRPDFDEFRVFPFEARIPGAAT
jgi:hypothetical protein